MVDEALRDELAREMDLPEGQLRRLLRELSFPMTPLVEGVRQENLDALERTLLALWNEYQQAQSVRNRNRMQQCRRLVIEAKDHARLAIRKLQDQTAGDRAEMVDWMLVWLENPAVFPTWLRLRRRALIESLPTEPE